MAHTTNLPTLLTRYFPPERTPVQLTAPLDILQLHEAINPTHCEAKPPLPAQVFKLTGANLWVWKAELRSRLLWQVRGSDAIPLLQAHTSNAFLFISYRSAMPHITACAALPADWAVIKDKENLPLHFLQSDVGISRVILLPELVLSLRKYASQFQAARLLNR